MIYVDLYNLDHPPVQIASAGFEPRSIGQTWTWTKNVIEDVYGCDRDEIDLDDDDYITVRGSRVAVSKLRVSAAA